MDHEEHRYQLTTIWEGNRGQGTKNYQSYDRLCRIVVPDKPNIIGTADLAFRGVPGKHNPEELLLAALSTCHLLSYLALCARQNVNVTKYTDEAIGAMTIGQGGIGSFKEVILHPHVTIGGGSDRDLAHRLHAEANKICYIANSCNFPVHHQPTIEIEGMNRER